MLFGFADFEGVGGAVNGGSFGAPGTHVDRADMLGHPMDEGARAEFIRRTEHHETRQGAHDGVVFHRLLAGSVFADGDAAVRADKFGVYAWISHAHAQLVVAFITEEDGER